MIGEVSKELFNLFDERIEMVKFQQKVQEYLNEVEKLVINLRKTKET